MTMSRLLWNIQALFYNRFRQNPVSDRILRGENIRIIELLEVLAGKQIRYTLDVGTGRGNSLALLSSLKPHRVVAIDYSQEMIHHSRSAFPGVHFLQGDAENLPFRSSSFDLILVVGFTEYMKNFSDFLADIQRALAPGGFVLLTIAPPRFPNYIRFMIGHRLFLRNEAEMQAHLSNTTFKIQASRQSFLQNQYLLQKTGK